MTNVPARMKIIPLASDQDTRALGARLAAGLRRGDVIALRGDLGAGKTTLARGIIQAILGADEEVPSPTFALVQVYETADFPVWHFDLYRLDRAEDVLELGWDETSGGAALVEWPDRAGRLLPADRLDVFLETAAENSGEGRLARLEPRGEGWQTRIDDFFD